MTTIGAHGTVDNDSKEVILHLHEPSSLIGEKRGWEGHAVPIPNMTIYDLLYDHINNFSEP